MISDTFTANTQMEAFDTNGISLGVIGPLLIGDHLLTGETAEDRFIGVEFASGISALRVFYPQPDFELDHLQFDLPSADLQLSSTVPGSAVVGSSFVVTLSVTNLGPQAVTSAVVTNAEPGDVSIVSAVATSGTFDSMTGDWPIGSLAVGAGATLTLTLTATNVGQLQFESRVLSEALDRNPTNNALTRTILVPNPPLSPQAVGTERSLRWPGGFTGYELQTTTAIGPNAEWTLVRAPVELEAAIPSCAFPKPAASDSIVSCGLPHRAPDPTQPSNQHASCTNSSSTSSGITSCKPSRWPWQAAQLVLGGLPRDGLFAAIPAHHPALGVLAGHRQHARGD